MGLSPRKNWTQNKQIGDWPTKKIKKVVVFFGSVSWKNTTITEENMTPKIWQIQAIWIYEKCFFLAKVGVFTDESGVEIPWWPWFVHHKIGRQNANWKSTLGGFSNQNTILLMHVLQLHNQQTTVIHFSNQISNSWFSNVKAATIWVVPPILGIKHNSTVSLDISKWNACPQGVCPFVQGAGSCKHNKKNTPSINCCGHLAQ